MSDSEPSDGAVEQALRHAVRQVFKSGNLDNLTVKRVRKSAEEELDLSTDFLKNDAKWKDRSKQVIESEVAAQENGGQDDGNDSEDEAPKPARPKAKAQPAKSKAAAPKRKAPEKKKPSTAKTGSRKRQKMSVDQKPAESESELSELVDEDPAPKKTKKPAAAPVKADDSESELSELIDDEPAPKKKAAKKAAPAKGKTTKGKATTSKAAEPDDPNAAEIKRLQGWLVKCGIRKLWGKELKPYETPKAKINHLKGMLKDAGMDGRYSVEKARQIKEQRELAADLEAVQEGAKMWGQESDEEKGRPKRRLAKGLKDLEGLVDEDGGEETD
ncbi:hypothetical protein K490DRAFT_51550 [Saccharata proteae CBS 121410]|uniref:Transcriptional regulator n=1 Tax=Saccharata proteae CBS 121410 TaxID=1314787 RepID=A0A9P4LT88_9PEZI|nr:hypothetical protein K490DRAFT_51550 [Saccharata proteae CBS 121410]